LLPPCRLEAFGSEFYGEEAIVHRFCRTPFLLSEHVTLVQGPGHFAAFGEDTALFADLFGSNVARLWRLGPGLAADAEPALDVPFDADLSQSRGDVAMRAEDHPALPPEAFQHLEQIGCELSRGLSGEQDSIPYRIRAFLVRAFTQDNVGAALFSLYQVGPSAVRATGFSYAAALFRTEENELAAYRIVRDKAGRSAVDARPWRPRVE
jgi:hypothetical protein